MTLCIIFAEIEIPTDFSHLLRVANLILLTMAAPLPFLYLFGEFTMTTQILLAFYFFGFVIAFYQAIISYFPLLQYEEKKRALITGNKPLLLFLAIRVLLWPYYVCRYQSPLSYFSTLVFSHYGEKGKTYSGTQGIKNFYNDIFKRGYYKNIKPKQKLIPLAEDSSMYQQALSAGAIGKGDLAYANVLFAKDGANCYLLSINFCQSWREFSEQSISRYALYACQKFTKDNFISVINTMHEGYGQQLAEALDKQCLSQGER